jgi:hypothetical protein
VLQGSGARINRPSVENLGSSGIWGFGQFSIVIPAFRSTSIFEYVSLTHLQKKFQLQHSSPAIAPIFQHMPLPNIKQLSEFILPIMDNPQLFPLVERIASWDYCPSGDSDTTLSALFLRRIMDNKADFFDRFQPSSKSTLWKNNSFYFEQEVTLQ